MSISAILFYWTRRKKNRLKIKFFTANGLKKLTENRKLNSLYFLQRKQSKNPIPRYYLFAVHAHPPLNQRAVQRQSMHAAESIGARRIAALIVTHRRNK